MKNLLLGIVFITSMLYLTACGKTAETSSPIAGTWKYENSEIIRYIFNNNGTGIYKVANEELPFTYEIKDNKLSIMYENQTTASETEYTLSGDNLSIKDIEGKVMTYQKIKGYN